MSEPQDSEFDASARSRLAIGRTIVAPAHLWQRIQNAVGENPAPFSWPARLAAVAAGAVVYAGIAEGLDHFDSGSRPTDPSAVATLTEHFVLAAPYFESGKLEDRQIAALDLRPEMMLIRSSHSGTEIPR
jgi:hypothetical protein